ncbi:MAG: Septum site-determining protein MinC [Pelotomaculum sp. PtaB.Bin104]|nr:MAG: Septum site-determining protein MinC [Pelotomaculum sp. PtaB.Bin104]
MAHDMVRIKGTRNGLVIVLDPGCDFEEIKATLSRKMESARGFFKGAKFSLFHGQQHIPAEQKNELESICKQFGLVPNAENYTAIRSDFGLESTAPSHSKPGEGALMVRRSLRAGQKIASPDHIIVLGNVHPGAEVVSGGNILVLGSCRGLIHAGAGGNRQARIIAQHLAPTVISIADRRYAPERTAHLPSGHCLARLSGQEIIFERYGAEAK